MLLPSGIYRLPPELLVEIFSLCWHSFTPRFGEIDTPQNPDHSNFDRKTVTVSFKTEIARVAHAPLLVVAEVCANWRAVAMGTPSLWCDIQLASVLWDTPSHITAVLGLLELALARGGTLPLIVELSDIVDHPFPPPILDLLAVHSQRWRELDCPLSLIDAFSATRGKLPRLQRLEIELSDEVPESLGILDDTLPSLKTLICPAPFIAHSVDKLQLQQLSACGCTYTTSHDICDALVLIARLPKAAQFHLQLYLATEPELWLDMDIRPLTSNIFTLDIQLLLEWDLTHSKMALGTIFTALTLPFLERLELESQEYPQCPIIWPHAEFLALSARSGFEAHLQALEMYEVHITESQLLECLSGLHSLERLAISDHETNEDDGGVDEHLITDNLLVKLTHMPDSVCLVPRLASLGFQTFLRFDDRALQALAVSRLDASGASQNSGGFELELSWLPGYERKLDDTFLASLEELKLTTRRRFTFTMWGAAEEEWV